MPFALYPSDKVIYENGSEYSVDNLNVLEADPLDFDDHLTHLVSIEGDRIVDEKSTGMLERYTNVRATQPHTLIQRTANNTRADVTDVPITYHHLFLEGGGKIYEVTAVQVVNVQ